LDIVMLDVCQNLVLCECNGLPHGDVHRSLTLALKAVTSSSVRVSDLAITGIRLTLVWRRFMTSISKGFSE
jgi:hypothetical protein